MPRLYTSYCITIVILKNKTYQLSCFHSDSCLGHEMEMDSEFFGLWHHILALYFLAMKCYIRRCADAFVDLAVVIEYHDQGCRITYGGYMIQCDVAFFIMNWCIQFPTRLHIYWNGIWLESKSGFWVGWHRCWGTEEESIISMFWECRIKQLV